MYENINIIINPEVLLSIVVLSLVLYGINLSTLKISIGVLFIVGIMIEVDSVEIGQSLCYITRGL